MKTKQNIENGHEYVDLGLSVKWATCNVGASSPEEYGDYFAYGETEPKENYDLCNYKFAIDGGYTFTKYNETDNKTTLYIDDDAARKNFGGKWRIPTYDEMKELKEKCTWKWKTCNGVKGCEVKSKINGNSIFLPAAGFCRDVFEFLGVFGFYASNLLYITRCSYKYFDRLFELSFSDYSVNLNERGFRPDGISVRPVCE